VPDDADVQLIWARPTAPRSAERLLSPGELARLDRLVTAADRDLFRSAHVLARQAVASSLGLPVEEVLLVQHCAHCGGGHGRPVAAVSGHVVPELSIAHAPGIVVVATATQPVGVDVEPVDRAAAGLADVILAPSERAQLDALPAETRDEMTLRWWVRKEAALKALGVGLDVDPSGLEVTAPGSVGQAWAGPGPAPPVGIVDVDLLPGFAAAVAVVGAAAPTVAVRAVDLTRCLTGVQGAAPRRARAASPQRPLLRPWR
jgi:4'-phosphopantetheinyl transferase